MQPAKSKQAAPADKNEAKPQTPADIINARGFWDAVPKQATPAQVAAISARNALNSTDPQSTASVSAAFQALAYAPAASPVDRANVVAASAPMPRSARPAARNPMAATDDRYGRRQGTAGSAERGCDRDANCRLQG